MWSRKLREYGIERRKRDVKKREKIYITGIELSRLKRPREPPGNKRKTGFWSRKRNVYHGIGRLISRPKREEESSWLKRWKRQGKEK